ncbi:MAG: MutS-related protein, partial [Solirubrobacteraceae bacterium]
EPADRWRSSAEVPFRSILFDREVVVDEAAEQPPCFVDLRLDQVVAGVLTGRDDYGLAPFFHQPLHEVEAVLYRHQVLSDLEHEAVLDAVTAFARRMRRMRECLALAGRLHHELQQQRWFLAAVDRYCDAIVELRERLEAAQLRSSGFAGLRDHVAEYADSEAFGTLAGDTERVKDALAAVRYTVHARGPHVRVRRYEDEPDMSEEVLQTFSRFQQAAATDYLVRFRDPAEMNHIEARILDLVAELHPDAFAQLRAFRTVHDDYLDHTIGRFDREVQFYLAYIEYVEPLRAAGLSFCRPRVSARSRELRVLDTFDLALAAKLTSERAPIVVNDIELRDPERVIVVSGPNNGGKTTFARTFGQLHHLAALGLPVPGREARLFLPDRIFTHFEREEEIETLRGKFEDELHRIREILGEATGASVLVMNESFGSTTLRDARLVGGEIVRRILKLDALCVFVTFVDELASLSDATVSMMSTVVADDPAVRTFKVLRRPANGLAYAAAIAEKHELSYEALRRRIGR